MSGRENRDALAGLRTRVCACASGERRLCGRLAHERCEE